MKKFLQVLHIEDSADDFDIVRRMLAKGGLDCEMKRIETREEVFNELEHNSYDLILSDCKLPNFSGLHALEIAHALKPEVPFIFLSGTIGEDTAIESMRNGATDYVLKDRLSRLVPAVRRALAEAEERTLCRQMQQRLREAGRLEAISTLSQGIAHDFNNVLTIILGHASLLTVEKERPDRVEEIAGVITKAGQRASEIVQQLMAFAHKSESRLILTDLNRWLEDNLKLFRGVLSPRVTLTLQTGNDVPAVMIHTGQLERILLNLINNSIEAMASGGQMTLSTRVIPAAERPDLLPDLDGGSFVCLTVADTGRGMPASTRDHIFEPFYTTKERGRGTGLGLPVVYGLMQAQHGYIDIASEPDKGTTVSLFFPVPKPASTPVSGVSRGLDPALCGKETILVIEDEIDVSFFLETILESHGYKVLAAHDGDEALALYDQHAGEVRMVLSDIGLPKMDGIAVCQLLKDRNPGLHIVLASGYSSANFQERLEHLGNEAYISKPYSTVEILKCVRKIFDGMPVLSNQA